MDLIYDKLIENRKFYSLLSEQYNILEENMIHNVYENKIKINTRMVVEGKNLKSFIKFFSKIINLNEKVLEIELYIDKNLNSITYKMQSENVFEMTGELLFCNQNTLLIHNSEMKKSTFGVKKTFSEYVKKNIENDILKILSFIKNIL